jgi:hypothetical protein
MTPGSLDYRDRGSGSPVARLPAGRGRSAPTGVSNDPNDGGDTGRQQPFQAMGPSGRPTRGHSDPKTLIRSWRDGNHPARGHRTDPAPSPGDGAIRLYNQGGETRHAQPESTWRCRDSAMPSPHRRIGASTLSAAGGWHEPDSHASAPRPKRPPSGHARRSSALRSVRRPTRNAGGVRWS